MISFINEGTHAFINKRINDGSKLWFFLSWTWTKFQKKIEKIVSCLKKIIWNTWSYYREPTPPNKIDWEYKHAHLIPYRKTSFRSNLRRKKNCFFLFWAMAWVQSTLSMNYYYHLSSMWHRVKILKPLVSSDSILQQNRLKWVPRRGFSIIYFQKKIEM